MQISVTDRQFFDRKSARKIQILTAYFFAFFAILTIFTIFANAQVNTTTLPAPRPTTTPTYPNPTRPPVAGTIYQPVPRTPSVWDRKKRADNENEFPAEKSIEVDSKVTVTIPCVSEGNIKINGWDRDEIRAYVKDGSEVGFKIAKKNPASGKPAWVYVLGYDPQKNKQLGLDECLSGEEIELDVPRNASIDIKSGQGSVSIESVYKARVKNEGGSVWLNDITQGVNAQTYEGDLTVENSKGGMILRSTTGNILALNVQPVEIGDLLSARTNGGTITLQSVEHSQVDSNSTSGLIKLISNIASGGQYRLTTNGAILLVIPVQSSCTINAIYGNFQSEIPLLNRTQIPSPGVQKITGQFGSGDATLTLQTLGIIRIKKSN